MVLISCQFVVFGERKHPHPPTFGPSWPLAYGVLCLLLLFLCYRNCLRIFNFDEWVMSNACRNSALFLSSSGLMSVLFRKCWSLWSMFAHCCMLSGKDPISFLICWTPWHSKTRWDSVLFLIPHIGHILIGKDVRFPSSASPNLKLVRIFLPFMLDRYERGWLPVVVNTGYALSEWAQWRWGLHLCLHFCLT